MSHCYLALQQNASTRGLKQYERTAASHQKPLPTGNGHSHVMGMMWPDGWLMCHLKSGLATFKKPKNKEFRWVLV